MLAGLRVDQVSNTRLNCSSSCLVYDAYVSVALIHVELHLLHLSGQKTETEFHRQRPWAVFVPGEQMTIDIEVARVCCTLSCTFPCTCIPSYDSRNGETPCASRFPTNNQRFPLHLFLPVRC